MGEDAVLSYCHSNMLWKRTVVYLTVLWGQRVSELVLFLRTEVRAWGYQQGCSWKSLGIIQYQVHLGCYSPLRSASKANFSFQRFPCCSYTWSPNSHKKHYSAGLTSLWLTLLSYICTFINNLFLQVCDVF